MNKTVWVVLALAVLGGFGMFFYNQSNQTSTTLVNQPAVQTQTPSSSESAITPVSDNVVTYADSGFSPASLTVKAGDTVTFKNDSSKMMWVASTPHPTHTDLPGFDGLKGIANGETYSYTFAKMGTWKFHNHLFPKDGGSIIVQ